MTTYAYKAKDKAGNTLDGSLEATDQQAAASQIREMGYWPLEVKEQAQKTARKGFSLLALVSPIWTGVSIRAQAVFFRQLATMLQAGMMLSEALESLGRQRGMGRLSVIARQAAEQVRSGGRLSDVLDQQGAAFSGIQIGLVRAGETGGMLDSMIDRIATYLERELELRHKFSRVTFYPKMLFVAILLMPSLIGLITDKITLDSMISHILTLFLVLLGLYVAAKILLAIPPIRLAWDLFKISFPVLGAISRKLAMSRFSTALSVMYSAGMPLSQAVQMSSMAVGNVVLRRAVASTVPELQGGGQLTAALQKTGKVPELVLSMIATGERTGSLDVTLDKVSDYYDNEAATTLEKTGYLLFVLLILIAGIMVLLIALNFYSGQLSGLGL